MAIVRWDPFRELDTLRSRMNQVFEDSIRRRELPGGDEEVGGSWAPAVDIFETPEKIVVKAEVPGIPEDAIDIQVAEGTLTLKGERRFEKEEHKGSYHRLERAYGAFQRSFSLPSSIDPERISASYDSGVLSIEMPKREENKPRKVQVKIEPKK
jgi:HSP20 family protein